MVKPRTCLSDTFPLGGKFKSIFGKCIAPKRSMKKSASRDFLPFDDSFDLILNALKKYGFQMNERLGGYVTFVYYVFRQGSHRSHVGNLFITKSSMPSQSSAFDRGPSPNS